MYIDATLEKYGQEYNDAKARGDTAGMAAAHEKAEAYRKANNPAYTGSADGSTYQGPSSSSSTNSQVSITTGNNTPVYGGSQFDTIPEYNLSGALARPFENIGSAITTATDGFKVFVEKFFALAIFWLPWAFLAMFITKLVRGSAKLKAGPVSVSAGK